MLESITIQRNISTLREQANRCANDTDAGRAEFNTLRGKLADEEKAWRAALDREQVAPRGLDGGETRALAELHGRASLRAIVDSAVNQRSTEGAESGGPAGLVPGPERYPLGDAGRARDRCCAPMRTPARRRSSGRRSGRSWIAYSPAARLLPWAFRRPLPGRAMSCSTS